MTPEKWLGRMRDCWDFAAPGCLELEEWLDSHYEPLTREMLRLIPIPAGGRCLDVGCGTGLLTRRLAAACREAVGADPAPAMIETARERSRGVPNLAFHALGAEDPLPDGEPFDAVYSRLAIMFSHDCEAAFRQVADVTRRGGGLAVAVWGPDHQNQWSEVPFRVLADYHGLRPTEPRDPGAFRLADPAETLDLLRAAGWEPVGQTPIAVPGWEEGGPAETWERLRLTAGPIGTLFDKIPEEDRSMVRERILDAYAKVPPGGLTGVAWVHAARRA